MKIIPSSYDPPAYHKVDCHGGSFHVCIDVTNMNTAGHDVTFERYFRKDECSSVLDGSSQARRNIRERNVSS